MDRRMREIAFLNHHIRNAMQTIELACSGTDNTQERVAVIDPCVQRVIEALSKLNREDDELILESGAFAV
jgi:hypothetical protein